MHFDQKTSPRKSSKSILEKLIKSFCQGFGKLAKKTAISQNVDQKATLNVLGPPTE